jgi:hypothetical protein
LLPRADEGMIASPILNMERTAKFVKHSFSELFLGSKFKAVLAIFSR